jgi:uncharacterized repeat protein (TIGR03803 family)
MKTRTGRWCTFTSIFLLSSFGFTARSAAQDKTFNQPSASPQLYERASKTRDEGAIPAPGYGYSVLYTFCSANCNDGAVPQFGSLIMDAAGNLYGTAEYGGAYANAFYYGGTVFKLDRAAHETVLYSFCAISQGSKCLDGANPVAGLIQDAAGSLYGTTMGGGANGNGGGLSPGTVFKLDSTGHETVLYNFCSVVVQGLFCADGVFPEAGLIQDAAGNLYGTTYQGGASLAYSGGTVFEVPSAGVYTVLYSFCSVVQGSVCLDGNNPVAGLIQDAAGNLYGETTNGGVSGTGTVFELAPPAQKGGAWTETVLYNIGGFPYGALIMDSAGNLYGTTAAGGIATTMNPSGEGTVFRLTPPAQSGGGWTATLLYEFCSVMQGAGCLDGNGPEDALVRDAAGNLFGTTTGGGAHNAGTVFALDSTGKETVLYSFCSVANCADGFNPRASLIRDAAGNLYGTTANGGVASNNCAGVGNGGGCGTMFELAVGRVGIALTSSANPSYVDQPVTFSVVVSNSGVTPTGSVTFEQGTTALGTVTLANGQASLTTTFAKSGSFPVVASYSGDQNYKAANSKPLKQVVNQYTTTTALASSLNPSTYGQAVTLTATVSSSGGPTPTGSVGFKNGTMSLGSASLSGGVATLTRLFAAGTLTIIASYSGDAANAKSTSQALNQVVNTATSTTTLVSSVNPSNSGQTVVFTATVTSPTAKPTDGKVKFMDGSTLLATGSLGGGQATYNTSTLNVGSHNITAVYSGTVNITGSTSSVLVQVVN